jgi:hypothetical protein
VEGFIVPAGLSPDLFGSTTPRIFSLTPVSLYAYSTVQNAGPDLIARDEYAPVLPLDPGRGLGCFSNASLSSEEM